MSLDLCGQTSAWITSSNAAAEDSSIWQCFVSAISDAETVTILMQLVGSKWVVLTLMEFPEPAALQRSFLTVLHMMALLQVKTLSSVLFKLTDKNFLTFQIVVSQPYLGIQVLNP